MGPRARSRSDDALDSVSFSGVALYSDNRIFGIPDFGVPVGSVVEWRARVRQKQAELFANTICFGGGYPTVEDTLEVDAPPEVTLGHAAFRLNEPVERAPDVSTVDGVTRWTFTERDLAPITLPANAPNHFHVRTCAHVWVKETTLPGVRGFADAPALSRYVHELNAPRHVVDDDIRATTASLLADAPPDPRERAARLYHWVQTEIDYCAIEVGIGGWQPHASTDTKRVRAGDCKDKANLLRALLTADGIPSRPVAIYSHDGYPYRFRVPALGMNFNHAILEVELPDEKVLVDPTTRVVPFGELPFGDQGADYLVSTEQGEDIARTAWSAPETNVEDVLVEGVLGDDGSLRARLTARATGEDARLFRNLYVSLLGKWRARALADVLDVPEDAIDDVTFTDAEPQPRPRPVTVALDLTRDHVIEGQGRTRIFRLARVADLPVPDIRDHRKLPTLLGVPGIHRLRVVVPVPPGFMVERLPDEVEREKRFASFHQRATLGDDGKLVIDREVIVREPVIEPADEKALRRFVAALRVAADNPVVLVRRDGGGR